MWLALAPEPDELERRLWAESDNDPCPAREAAHREVLDALVAAGDLRAPVAELVQLAFAEVSYHHWRLRAAGISCYVPGPTEGCWFVAWAPDREAGGATILQGLDAGGPVEPWQRPLDQPYRVQFVPRTDGAPETCAAAVPIADLPDDPDAMPLDDFHCSIEGLPPPVCPLPQ